MDGLYALTKRLHDWDDGAEDFAGVMLGGVAHDGEHRSERAQGRESIRAEKLPSNLRVGLSVDAAIDLAAQNAREEARRFR